MHSQRTSTHAKSGNGRPTSRTNTRGSTTIESTIITPLVLP